MGPILRQLLLIAAFGLGGNSDSANAEAKTNCPRSGTAHIRIAGQVFAVPRSILGQIELDTGKTDQSWRCSDQVINARNFFVDVTPTYAGAKFYQDWVHDRKLPQTIELAERGKFKYFNDERFAARVKRGARAIAEEGEFQTVETDGETFYMSKTLRGLQDQPIVFICSKHTSPRGVRTCHTNYRLNAHVDLRYEFHDPPNAMSDWVDLDRRTRQVISGFSSQFDR